MILEDWLSLIFIALCLGLSFFFSGSETALTAFSRARMLRLEKSGDRRATLVNRLAETRERLIGTILTGNNIVNIAASSLATGLLLSWFGDVGVLYATMIMTVVVVVFTEVLPKTFAINAPDRVSLLVAQPISLLVRLFGPMLVGIEALVRWICGCSVSASGSTRRSCLHTRNCVERSTCCTTTAASRSTIAIC